MKKCKLQKKKYYQETKTLFQKKKISLFFQKKSRLTNLNFKIFQIFKFLVRNMLFSFIFKNQIQNLLFF